MPRVINIERKDGIGYSNIPNQIVSDVRKKSFNISLLVIGEKKRKESLILSTLFNKNVFKKEEETKDKGCVRFSTSKTVLEEHGVSLSVKITEAFDLETTKEKNETKNSIASFLEESLEYSFISETKGWTIEQCDDNKGFDAVIFLIMPHERFLSKSKLDLLKEIHTMIPIIPIICKAEIMTQFELKRLKMNIHKQLKENNIKTLSFENVSWISEKNDRFWENFPISVPSGSFSRKEMFETELKTRNYPWGLLFLDDSSVSDFLLLRKILVSNYFGYLKREAVFMYEDYKKLFADFVWKKKIKELSASGDLKEVNANGDLKELSKTFGQLFEVNAVTNSEKEFLNNEKKTVEFQK